MVGRNRRTVCYVGSLFVLMYTINVCWKFYVTFNGTYPVYLGSSKLLYESVTHKYSTMDAVTSPKADDEADISTQIHGAAMTDTTKMARWAADYKFNFKFLQNPIVKCINISYNETTLFLSGKAKVDFNVIFVIKSAPSNKQRRDVIRRTWGNEDYMYQNGVTLRTVFVIGVTNVSSYNEEIAEEIRNHGDIIHVNFIDSYYNNTLKSISSVNWVSKYCSKADFVALLDDDYLVNPHNFVKMIQEIPPQKRDSLYMGRLFEGYGPHRDPKSKWYISKEEYPSETYPPFISAGTVLLSIDVVNKFQRTMQYIKPFKLDDVYLSMVAEKLGIKPRTNYSQFINYRVMPGHSLFRELVTSHDYKVQHLDLAWKSIRTL